MMLPSLLSAFPYHPFVPHHTSQRPCALFLPASQWAPAFKPAPREWMRLRMGFLERKGHSGTHQHWGESVLPQLFHVWPCCLVGDVFLPLIHICIFQEDQGTSPSWVLRSWLAWGTGASQFLWRIAGLFLMLGDKSLLA